MNQKQIEEFVAARIKETLVQLKNDLIFLCKLSESEAKVAILNYIERKVLNVQ